MYLLQQALGYVKLRPQIPPGLLQLGDALAEIVHARVDRLERLQVAVNGGLVLLNLGEHRHHDRPEPVFCRLVALAE